MMVTIKIPEELAERIQEQAQARGLPAVEWLLELAEQNAPAASITHFQRTNH
jgi:hypothetical protein